MAKEHHIEDFDIIRHHLGELTDEENQRVVHWSLENAQNMLQYLLYQKVIHLLDEIKLVKAHSFQKAWNKVNSHLF